MSSAVPRSIAADQAPSMLRIKKSLAWCYVSAPLYLQVVGGEY